MALVQYMIILHTADIPRLFSNNKLLSFVVIKFICSISHSKYKCFHGAGQHCNAVSIEILLVHTLISCATTFLLQHCLGLGIIL